jgi:hypothetical protein
MAAIGSREAEAGVLCHAVFNHVFCNYFLRFSIIRKKLLSKIAKNTPNFTPELRKSIKKPGFCRILAENLRKSIMVRKCVAIFDFFK